MPSGPPRNVTMKTYIILKNKVSATISWLPPYDLGGSDNTRYIVALCKVDKSNGTLSGCRSFDRGLLEVFVTDLTEKTTFKVTVSVLGSVSSMGTVKIKGGEETTLYTSPPYSKYKPFQLLSVLVFFSNPRLGYSKGWYHKPYL